MKVLSNGLEINLKNVGIAILIVAIVFLGWKYIQLSKTVKVVIATQQFIGKALIDKGIIKVQQPQVQTQSQTQKAPEAMKKEEGK